MDDQPDATADDAAAALRKRARLTYEAETAETAKRLEYQVDFAKVVLQSLTFANGGGIVALYTFAGGLAKTANAPVTVSHWLWAAFAAFGLGLLCTILAGASGFYAQRFYYDCSQRKAWNALDESLGRQPSEDADAPARLGNVFLIASTFAAFAAIAAFLVGAGTALEAIQS